MTRKGKPYPMIRLEIINLFLEYHRPQILAQKLDDVQLIRESGSVPREPLRQTLAHPKTQTFETHVHAVAEDICFGETVCCERWYGGASTNARGRRWGRVCRRDGSSAGDGARRRGCCGALLLCGVTRRRTIDRGFETAGHALGEWHEFDQQEVEGRYVHQKRCVGEGVCGRSCGCGHFESQRSLGTGPLAAKVHLLREGVGVRGIQGTVIALTSWTCSVAVPYWACGVAASLFGLLTCDLEKVLHVVQLHGAGGVDCTITCHYVARLKVSDLPLVHHLCKFYRVLKVYYASLS